MTAWSKTARNIFPFQFSLFVYRGFLLLARTDCAQLTWWSPGLSESVMWLGVTGEDWWQVWISQITARHPPPPHRGSECLYSKSHYALLPLGACVVLHSGLTPLYQVFTGLKSWLSRERRHSFNTPSPGSPVILLECIPNTTECLRITSVMFIIQFIVRSFIQYIMIW